MKLQRLLSTALAVTLTTTISAFAQQQGDKPTTPSGSIQVVDQHDWGTVAPGQLQAELKITNVGKGPLTIENVKPSCGCTAAPLDDYLLDPGESTMMHITLNASHEGPLSKSVAIYSDDPASPTKIISLRGNVQSDVSYEPNVTWLIFDNAVVGQEATTSVRIKNNSKEPLTVYPPEMTQGEGVRFNLTKETVIQPGQDFELVAKVTPESSAPINAKAMVRTSSNFAGMREFTIYGNVTDKASGTSQDHTMIDTSAQQK